MIGVITKTLQRQYLCDILHGSRQVGWRPATQPENPIWVTGCIGFSSAHAAELVCSPPVSWLYVHGKVNLKHFTSSSISEADEPFSHGDPMGSPALD